MNLREVFDSLDEAGIDRFIADQQEENLHLDFKTVNNADMSRDDRRTFAKGLSGFANSDGGLIVWGVDARKNADGVDCAAARTEIPSLSRFLSRLNQLTSEAVNPVVDGVMHRKIVVGVGDTGFGVTLVPASDAGPHMAKAGEDRYFKRSGDSFVRLEHFDLEDMFGRRQRPVLSLVHRIDRGSVTSIAGEKSYDVRVFLGIANTGRGSARAPYFGADVSQPYRLPSSGSSVATNEGLKRLAGVVESHWQRFGGMADVMIHPGTTFEVTRVEGQISDRTSKVPDLRLRYQIAADGFRLFTGELVIPGADLLAAMRAGT